MREDIRAGVSNLKMLINGQGVTSAQNLEVINPCNEEIVAQVPDATVTDLDQAITAAKSALVGWSDDEALRKSVLLSIASVIHENQEALARALSLETGLPLANTKDEVGMAAYFFKYRSKTVVPVDIIHDDERQRVQVVRKPVGVVGAIIPWNAPMMIASEKISTAFAAGNTVVLKTSPLAPLALLLLGQLLADKVPAGVLNILSGGDVIGKQMVADPRIGMISFTGSTEAGKAIMASGGATLKRLSLELGGMIRQLCCQMLILKKLPQNCFGAPSTVQDRFVQQSNVCTRMSRCMTNWLLQWRNWQQKQLRQMPLMRGR